MVSTCLATVEALEKNLLQSSPKTKIENENIEIEYCIQNYSFMKNDIISDANLHLY